MRGPKVHGLLHTGLTVSDFEAAVAWWSELFGFLLVAEETIEGAQADALAELFGGTGLTIRLGFLRAPDGNVLEIFQLDPPLPARATEFRRPGFTHVALAVRDVPGVRRRLEARGVEFITGVEHNAGAHWSYFRDPDGNLVEIIDVHAARLPPCAGGAPSRYTRARAVRRTYSAPRFRLVPKSAGPVTCAFATAPRPMVEHCTSVCVAVRDESPRATRSQRAGA